MQPPSAQESTEKPSRDARRRGSRIISAAFVTVASVFVALSTLQIVPQALGLGARSLASASAPGGAGAGCAEGVASLARALDRGLASASSAQTADEEAAVATLRASLSPEWSGEAQVAAACNESPGGQDAFAALLRLKLAEEHFVRNDVVEIAPLRRDVAAYLAH